MKKICSLFSKNSRGLEVLQNITLIKKNVLSQNESVKIVIKKKKLVMKIYKDGSFILDLRYYHFYIIMGIADLKYGLLLKYLFQRTHYRGG